MELGGTGWELGGTGRIWKELGGTGKNQVELGGTRRNWVELGGSGLIGKKLNRGLI